MAGEQQRQQLVADLLVGQPVALLVAGEQQRREDVVALLQLGLGPAAGDLGEEDLVDGPLAAPRTPAPPGARRRPRTTRADHHQPAAARERLDHRRAGAPAARPGPAPGVVAEHGPQDDPQRQRLHRRQHRERLADRPAVDLGVGAVAHRLGVGEHLPAVERGQHQPAMAQVLGAVEQQHRALADDRARAARWPRRRADCSFEPWKTCLTSAGSNTITNRSSNSVREGDRAAVAAAARLEKARAEQHEPGRLQHAGQARPGRQRSARRRRGRRGRHRPIALTRASAWRRRRAREIGEGERVRRRLSRIWRAGHPQLGVDVQQLARRAAPASPGPRPSARSRRRPPGGRQVAGAHADAPGRWRGGAERPAAGVALEHVQLVGVGIAQRPQLGRRDQHAVDREDRQVAGHPARGGRDPLGRRRRSAGSPA